MLWMLMGPAQPLLMVRERRQRLHRWFNLLECGFVSIEGSGPVIENITKLLTEVVVLKKNHYYNFLISFSST